ncbi:hypothetical protein [Helicobacter burdigaliensis]|uniref:hypothetical protein n=1 Tax=Helicobacter burdigaliensis TaxID=2315334 RepID=UPI000EF67A9F|nr:hypothetical protein [Helicobacter burdigaliensis]
MAQEEIEVSFEKEPKKNFGVILLVLVVIILAVFGLVYYVLSQPYGKNMLENLQNAFGVQQSTTATSSLSMEAKDEEIKRLQVALRQKEQDLLKLSSSVKGLGESVEQMKKDQNALANNLRYSIKPKKQIIVECYSMEVGKWDIPKGCLLSIATKVGNELESDNRVVAFEVQGFVDTKPYAGSSPELKQEGLASFRAREAIREINKKLPNATVFEGPSIQVEDKRGYSIKAYFVN